MEIFLNLKDEQIIIQGETEFEKSFITELEFMKFKTKVIVGEGYESMYIDYESMKKNKE